MSEPPESRRFLKWFAAGAVAAVAIGIAAWAQLGAHRAPAVSGFKVVAAYPHDPAAFTQGLAIEGGLDIAPMLGSVSTYVRGAIGGIEGRRLQKNDVLPLNRSDVAHRDERALESALDLAFNQPVRVVLGPQADHFTERGLDTFLCSPYTVSTQSDRMGFRLDGPAIEHVSDYHIVSDGVVSGSIQVPGTGRPIILMVDNQTTGGYPKIATVVSADLPVVGRRRTGRTIRFSAVAVEEAERLRRAQEAALQQQIDRIRNVAAHVSTA